ncbi:MAG: response regulator [Cellvibrionaceae bacterium]
MKNPPTPEQQEILALLCGELAELAEQDTTVFTGGSVDQQVDVLQNFEQECEQLGNALNLSGLVGLAAVCRLLHDNFHSLATASCAVSEDTAAVLRDWAMQLHDYLQEFTACRDLANTQLLDFLSLPAWPLPLSTKARATMDEQLANAELASVDEREELPATVDPDMVSLTIPSDVRSDLLDGLLLELPEQVRGFERSVNTFLESAKVADLDTAQRMAHTLKGAANVVGVAGIANLMHYCEDLLEAVGGTKTQLPEGFGELLIDVSDCLTAMAENLCGLGPAPDNAEAVLQSLLDFIRELRGSPASAEQHSSEIVEFDLGELEQLEVSANGPDADTIDWSASKEAELAIETEQSEEPTINLNKDGGRDASTQHNDDERHYINLPETVAQQLLRIAGEGQIATTQLMTQIAAMHASIQLTDRYHKQIRTMAADLEALIQTRTALNTAAVDYEDGGLDPLELEHYSELHSFSHQLLELTTDSYEAVAHIAQQIGDLTSVAYAQKQLNQDNRELLLELRLVPVETLASRFDRCVRQAARLTGKNARLIIEGGNLLMDSKVLSRIADPIMHLLRNAVDHGLEDDPTLRVDQGKEEQGTITLSFEHSGESIAIRCKDDGRGLDYQAIKDKALTAGLVDADELPSESFLDQLILLPGFSTRAKASQTSGRGIGLDAVTTEIKALRGQLTVSSAPGEGCCFDISVPASILTAHALVVRDDGDQGSNLVSLVTHSIEQLVYLEDEQLHAEGEEIFYEYDEERLPVFALNDFTNIHRATKQKSSALLIVRKADGSRIAIAVATIIASQDLVIKPLNRFCHHPEGVIGATITGDGTVSPVIDLQKLPGMNLSRKELASLRAQRAKIAAEQVREQVAPVVLIVDDSLSVRRSLAQFVADMGMQAYTARDGFEAINLLGQHRPTLMLVDLEMPRMNGLELTAHLRANDATRDIPVIMVTSRSTEKHRNMARSAGVNGYLNKPWSDEDLLSSIQQQIA